MEGRPLSLREAVRGVNISTCLIVSNDKKTKKDIVDALTDVYYYESILEPSIRVSLLYTDTGRSIEKNGKTTTILEGLPLVGQENTTLKLKDTNGVELKLTLYVNGVSPIKQDTLKSLIGLDLVSKELILNEKVRLNCRFDGKISDHIKKILKDTRFLATSKKIDIEETANNFNFMGNNKKPFYTSMWLSKKSIPQGFPSGNTAGFVFYETSDGFKFKSIESLLSDKVSGNKKTIKSFIFTNTPDGAGQTIPAGYLGKILEHNVDTPTGDIQSKLEIGTYSTRTILFDPFTCYYEVINPKAKDLKKNTAGKDLPKLNPEFDRVESNKDYSRTQYFLLDKGVLPSGNTKQQLEKSKDQNFDPKNILNQATMRYNQLFNSRVSITVAADFSLHAGDMIYIDAGKPGEGLGTEHSGNYVIADLCHYINKLQGGYTKLILIRDSVGKKGSPAYNPL
jgi:hypothetical protein